MLKTLAITAALLTSSAALAEPVVLTDDQMDTITAGAFLVTINSGLVTNLVINQTGPSSGSVTFTCSGECNVSATASAD